jgi:hypothetical protein
LWREALNDLFVKVLQFDDVVNRGTIAGEYEIKISFNDYSIPSFEQRIQTATSALNGGLVDVKHAIDLLFLDDLTDEEKELLVKNIKIENGIPITPDEVEAIANDLPDSVEATIEEDNELFLDDEDEDEDEDELEDDDDAERT